MKGIVYSVGEAAEIEGITYHQAVRKCNRGYYPNAYKVGWGWVVPEGDVKKQPKKKKKKPKKKLKKKVKK